MLSAPSPTFSRGDCSDRKHLSYYGNEGLGIFEQLLYTESVFPGGGWMFAG